MGRLHSFLRLPSAERRLLLRAAAVVVAVRISLWLFPFQRLRLFVEGQKRPLSGMPMTPSPQRIAWAVSVVSRYVPRASCLTQALAAQWLLGAVGQSGLLRIGVAKRGDGTFRAHAWLESSGGVLIGGGGLDDFSVFPPLAGKVPG
ncbi:MAG: lasso peptide biosynthesis B2 protein [Gemmatimonadota bacterium]|nr:lasso peptide biosynthesis B2 protein [Gemmatimonadota bacterium]